VHLNWRELLFVEAKWCSQELSYFSATAAKKNAGRRAVDFQIGTGRALQAWLIRQLASIGGWGTLRGKYNGVCLSTLTEATEGAPLLALFEKWPAELPTPFDSDSRARPRLDMGTTLVQNLPQSIEPDQLTPQTTVESPWALNLLTTRDVEVCRL
jgi:hypothetical protein